MSEWISVKDRLPSNTQRVLCTGLDFGEGPLRHYEVCEYDGKTFFIAMEESGFYEDRPYVTHWMPLPEAPK